MMGQYFPLCRNMYRAQHAREYTEKHEDQESCYTPIHKCFRTKLQFRPLSSLTLGAKRCAGLKVTRQEKWIPFNCLKRHYRSELQFTRDYKKYNDTEKTGFNPQSRSINWHTVGEVRVTVLLKFWSSSGSIKWWCPKSPNPKIIYMLSFRWECSVPPPGQGVSQWRNVILWVMGYSGSLWWSKSLQLPIILVPWTPLWPISNDDTPPSPLHGVSGNVLVLPQRRVIRAESFVWRKKTLPCLWRFASSPLSHLTPIL